MEIRGYEETIIVGLVREILCSTHLNVSQTEWFLVGVNDSLSQEKSYGSQNLVLTINASNTELNGAMFTCRVTDVDGKQYQETVTITVKSKFIPIGGAPYLTQIYLATFHIIPSFREILC